MASPCIHGDVCRAYIRERGCILRSTCPRCEHYEPVDKSVDTMHGAPAVDVRRLRYFPLWWDMD